MSLMILGKSKKAFDNFCCQKIIRRGHSYLCLQQLSLLSTHSTSWDELMDYVVANIQSTCGVYAFEDCETQAGNSVNLCNEMLTQSIKLVLEN